MSDRQLATIQKIKSIENIPGKDKIGFATFHSTGWKVIVSKSEFKVDDLVVYCEYDSILPIHPVFEFLRPRCFSQKWNGFRISAMKMAGVVSEGICFPLSIMVEFSPPFKKFEEGMDVTTSMGIVKYDPENEPENEEVIRKDNFVWNWLMRNKFLRNYFYPKSIKGWPSYFPAKTDSTRAQVLPRIFEEYQGLPVYVTVKKDGQSGSFGFNKNRLDVCSRNVYYKNENKSNHWIVAKKFNLKKSLKKYIKNNKLEFAVVQGEVLGPGIQGNKYGYKELTLALFNLYTKKKGEEPKYETWDELARFCYDFNIPSVPFVERREFNWKSIEELVEYARGNDPDYPTPREGVVIRALDTSVKSISKMWSGFWDFKVINPDFLVK